MKNKKLSRIKTKKAFLVDENENIVVLRGFSVADPFRLKNENNQNILNLIRQITQLGGTIIRIPIKPSLWQAIPNFLELYIDEAVQECKKHGIYCILDWHIIGNPIHNETLLKDQYYEANGKRYYDNEVSLKVAKSAWKEISERYGKYPHVIFEIFNEPAPGEKSIERMGLSALYWKEWKKEVEIIIKIIRKVSQNLILVPPIKWAYELSKTGESPVEAENIAYSVHPYPIHTEWKKNFLSVVGKLPLVVTEFGFKEKTNADFMRGTKKDYGNPIIEFMEKHKISWVAWCYDTIWGPKILIEWDGSKYTEWGVFITNKLKERVKAEK